MAKFNTGKTRAAVSSPVTTEATPSTTTHEGAAGYLRDEKSELFLLAVSNMVGEDSFYEKAGARDARYAGLVRRVAVADPAWIRDFLTWLRGEGNMRSAPLVGAAEAVKARLDAGVNGEVTSRSIVDAVLQRADEPGEMLAYWTSTFGRKIPKPVKRGVADAVRRLYTEYNLLKYDTDSKGFRFGDVIDLVHPRPRERQGTRYPTITEVVHRHGADPAEVEVRLRRRAETIRDGLPDDTYIKLGTAEFMRTPMPSLTDGWRARTVAQAIGIPTNALLNEMTTGKAPPAPWQGHLFQYALDRRHNRDNPIPAELTTVTANAAARRYAAEGDFSPLLDAEALRYAGMTWEDVLSLAGSKLDKRKLWEAIIPSMGYMALLRNLRNFDEAGVSDEVAGRVIAKFTDPDEVARSRQLPFRFFSAYRAAPSLRWGHALDTALTLATRNIPAFTGRTLVLVDTSASMTGGAISAKSTVTPAMAAALFGVSLAARGNAVDLVGFANGTFRHPVGKGASVLREIDNFVKRTGEVGHGTEIAASLRATYAGHERVVVISDMQTFHDYRGDVTSAVPAHVPMYGFNLGGYRPAAMPAGTGNRHEIGGMSDATFRMIPLLEAGRNADWPWLT